MQRGDSAAPEKWRGGGSQPPIHFLMVSSTSALRDPSHPLKGEAFVWQWFMKQIKRQRNFEDQRLFVFFPRPRDLPFLCSQGLRVSLGGHRQCQAGLQPEPARRLCSEALWSVYSAWGAPAGKSSSSQGRGLDLRKPMSQARLRLGGPGASSRARDTCHTAQAEA